MAVKVFWFDPKHTILAFEFYGKWVWEEVYTAVDEAHRLTQSVDYMYYVLVMPCDVEAQQHIPPNIIAHFPVLARRVAPNVVLDIIVLHGLIAFWRNLFQSIKSMYPILAQPFDLATSQEEALQMIQQHKERNAVASHP
ncbi:MAG: hypothetical protein U0694_05210 [Anaerolineae bacterium]